jgi:cell wall-associated NlpC family hydrolase
MKDSDLIAVMQRNGIVYPTITLSESRNAGLPLVCACAVLEQESSGGHNEFGHDGGASGNPIQGGPVTKQRYLEYKRYRDMGYLANGVGPMQLTWQGFQDQADRLGGCWQPDVNMRVGFSVLRANIRRDGMWAGYKAYNGTGPAADAYASSVMARTRRWQQLLAQPATAPAPQPTPGPNGPYAAQFVELCLKQRGDRYVWGAKPPYTDPNPTAFDCSGLVTWALKRIGIPAPDGTWWQQHWCEQRHTIIPIARAIGTQGGLLFRSTMGGHVAVSLGNGSTIEARGAAYGVNSFPANGRPWTAGALVPGLNYGRPASSPPHDGVSVAPPWPGRFFLQPPAMTGADVAQWQQRMLARGWPIGVVDGTYGPQSEAVCRGFQQRFGLVVDGVVGPDTWRAAWDAPLRP